MIDAKTFAEHHQTLWRSVAPASEITLRRINSGQLESIHAPIESKSSPDRRGLINETAFFLFCLKRSNPNLTGKELYKEAFNFARKRIEILTTNYETDLSSLSQPEKAEAADIARAIEEWTIQKFHNTETILQPVLFGAGFIDSSEADFISGNTIVEIKAGERKFRSVDIRQVLTYVFLNWQSQQFNITRVALFNPRMGISFCTSVKSLITEISGKSEVEFFSELLHATTSGEFSG